MRPLELGLVLPVIGLPINDGFSNWKTVGTWVLSALHRNPGLTVKVAEAIDEISDGRFLSGGRPLRPEAAPREFSEQ